MGKLCTCLHMYARSQPLHRLPESTLQAIIVGMHHGIRIVGALATYHLQSSERKRPFPPCTDGALEFTFLHMSTHSRQAHLENNFVLQTGYIARAALDTSASFAHEPSFSHSPYTLAELHVRM